jgi:hypothetical protein
LIDVWRAAAVLLAVLLVACAPQAGGTSKRVIVPSPSPRVLHPLPSPGAHPAYPPKDLADVVALADAAKTRRFIGMEDQQLDNCDRAWMRVLEPDGTPPRQVAADLMHVAIQRKGIFSSCGVFVYGTTDPSYCNCYRGDHGLLVIDRGPNYEPAPGMMRVTFSVRDTEASAQDWSVVMVAPDR